MAQLVASGAETQRAASGERIDRHHHESAYAALVLRGGYVEAGDRGRIRACPGAVLFHDAFDGHFDTIGSAGAEILNLSLRAAPGFDLGRCTDPDAIVRRAEGDPEAAAALLIGTTEPLPCGAADWPDLLAAALRGSPPVRLETWGVDHGLRPYEVSRGFVLSYGVTPKRYRLEQRASAAARAIRAGAALCDAAFTSGFADQPHMTRTVGTVFGRPPRQLRN